MVKHPAFGAARPMILAGRMTQERERLLGMTDAERNWRRLWLKDQVLTENDPQWIPEIYKTLFNPIRRFYRWPLDTLFGFLRPYLGTFAAFHLRQITGRTLLWTTLFYWVVYHNYYHPHDWTRTGGLTFITSKPTIHFGDVLFPFEPERTEPHDYAHYGFKYCTLKFYD